MSNENPFPNEEYKGAVFKRANMVGTDFDGVDLTDATFWAVLVNSVFKETNMQSAKFDDVNLGEADFNNINLSGSRYNEVNLSNAKFTGINLSSTQFSGLNMSNVEISDANTDGMKIDGVLVSDLFDAYNASAKS